MADLAMCNGVKGDLRCPMRERCYRHKATPSPDRQSWLMCAPFQATDLLTTCAMYWPMHPQTETGDT